jgi:hypothetical protein
LLMILLILAIADPVLTANGFARSDREYSTFRYFCNRKDASMWKVNEIKAAIESLPKKELIELRHWFSEKD